jgi:hypothetical protein
MTEIRMMAPTGMLGYGFTEEAFQRGMDMGLDFIGCDAGSMDPGPHYLGEGIPFVSRQAMKRDIGLLLEGAIGKGIPLLVGSAGGGGGAPQLQITREVIEEVAKEKGLHFEMALIHSEQNKGFLKAQRRAGKIEPLGPIEDLTDAEIDRSHRVVAMMGVEPFQKALKDGAQVVIAGRATDASIYSAIPLMRGFDPGLVWHLAKIIECGGQVVTPRTGQDCVVGTISKDHFVVEPGHPDKRCTRMRIAAHTLYENPSPYELEEPDGTLVTTHSAYEQIDDRRVKVSGSKFKPSARYTVKLEGVRHAGYRTVFMAGVRDPILIGVINEFIASCIERAGREAQTLGISADQYKANVKVYGVNATMGSREPHFRIGRDAAGVRNALPHEVGLLADVLADDRDTSKAIMAKLRYALLHTDFPGRKCISGNLAIPFSPSDMHVGAAYEFSVWHRMEIADPLAPFPIEMVSV